jgi:light-regulated signal transduction histidine kinase (bacteriophytochrome)
MAQLIDDLLSLSRVNRTELRTERVDISRMAEDIASEISRSRPDREVEVRVQPGLVALGDARLVRAALENLIGNAFKFTSKRAQAAIEVGGARSDDGQLEVFVRDNGAGFDMAYANKLFGAFQRLHSASEFEGTGIGLATVRRIVERHGGTVKARGAVDQGATFSFTLPSEAKEAA